jgi:hypothetical protein
VTPAGFKPTTSGTGILRSIQLNYEAFVVYCDAKVSIFVGLSKCGTTKNKVLHSLNFIGINTNIGLILLGKLQRCVLHIGFIMRRK